MAAGFARLQSAENALIPALVADAGVARLVELAPLASPSPRVPVSRERILFHEGQWHYPFRAPALELPFADGTLPAILVRHLFQPDVPRGVFAEILRCLQPGGLLLSVSANPWHSAAWREVGRGALRLPSWPLLLVSHARQDLELQIPRTYWRGLLPGLAPVLVIAGRKPPRPIDVRPVKFSRRVPDGATAVPSQCRAA